MNSGLTAGMAASVLPTNRLRVRGMVAITPPTTSAIMARTDAAQTFTGTQTIASLLTVALNGGANTGLALGPNATDALIQQRTTTTADFLARDFSAWAGIRILGVGLNGGNLTLVSGLIIAGSGSDVSLSRGATNTWYVGNGSSNTSGHLSLTNLTAAGDLIVSTAGKGLQLKAGTGARGGNATLVAGTVTVTNTTVTANTLVTLARKTSGGTIGTSITYTLSAGASFTINSDNPLDTSTFTYTVTELNP